jgi:hypothetical protein
MKLYNPFKPHICQNSDGSYSVRKLTALGWSKLSSFGTLWQVEANLYCHFSAQEAVALFEKVTCPKIILRDKYVSVYDLKAKAALEIFDNETAIGRK